VPVLFKHILVPLDFSDKNDAALETVHGMVSLNSSVVSLLHVVETIGSPEDLEIQKFTQQLQEHSEKELLKRAQRFRDLDITVTCESRSGNRVQETLAFAADNEVDLIVLNSHQMIDNKSSSASISYQIAILANCPVLLLK
jgi:nucleotide-binding universal stress UspA family protein